MKVKALLRRLRFRLGDSFSSSFYAIYNEREVTREEWERLLKPAFDKVHEAFAEVNEAFKRMKP